MPNLDLEIVANHDPRRTNLIHKQEVLKVLFLQSAQFDWVVHTLNFVVKVLEDLDVKKRHWVKSCRDNLLKEQWNCLPRIESLGHHFFVVVEIRRLR